MIESWCRLYTCRVPGSWHCIPSGTDIYSQFGFIFVYVHANMSDKYTSSRACTNIDVWDLLFSGGGGGGGGNTFWPVLHGITNPYARTGAQGGGGVSNTPFGSWNKRFFFCSSERLVRGPYPVPIWKIWRGKNGVGFPPPPRLSRAGAASRLACTTPPFQKKKSYIIRTPLCPNPRRVWGGGELVHYFPPRARNFLYFSSSVA